VRLDDVAAPARPALEGPVDGLSLGPVCPGIVSRMASRATGPTVLATVASKRGMLAFADCNLFPKLES
jgi:hypothetical protein